MAVTKTRIESNLRRIREDVAAACTRAGRKPEAVSIVAVTKAVDFQTTKNLLDAGLVDIGENRSDQLAERAAQMTAHLQRRRTRPAGPVKWHMIGHLQRNKVRSLIDVVSVIHSLDSLRLAEEINVRAERAERVVDVFLQVNCSGERQKSGCAVGAATHLGDLICTLKNLRLLGLMTMAPLVAEPERARPTFVRLREIFEEMAHDKIGGPAGIHLSMGMSQDYVVAVEEGATVLRIGSALFQ